ncbi:nitric oxide reductase NorE protein [Aquiflexum balticum DSM 16537]|uniref:Nitric oxide reductase NorE protein n=1 Tax=Aquiflexum balticum DSM 16537 TaxID=758820 RepID=A0A1W2HAQ6_9BACT|nr:cytochrome c oxidase subunit 3 [Aquiflexum balticum]SMD45985.1 nitric oxide reductase NorE protein [Aquiflexum balticum DSM 16537]
MELKTLKIDHQDIFYPPGGVLLWIIIILELVTFGLGIGGLVYYGKLEPELFHKSRLLLNAPLGMLNTIVLLVSGYFMANTVSKLRLGELSASKFSLAFTMFGGLIFVVLKSWEYLEKLSSDIEMTDNMFFTFYWLLSGFHLAHVLIGLVILMVIWFNLKNKNEATVVSDVESGAAFWHMCDLIWLLLFPSLYLVF